MDAEAMAQWLGDNVGDRFKHVEMTMDGKLFVTAGSYSFFNSMPTFDELLCHRLVYELDKCKRMEKEIEEEDTVTDQVSVAESRKDTLTDEYQLFYDG